MSSSSFCQTIAKIEVDKVEVDTNWFITHSYKVDLPLTKPTYYEKNKTFGYHKAIRLLYVKSHLMLVNLQKEI